MKFPALVARKVGMTRMLDESGRLVPVTLLKVEDQKVTKTLTKEKDGYSAIQVGYYPKKEKHLTKPDISRLRKVGVSDNYARFQEMRLESDPDLSIGAEPDVCLLYTSPSPRDQRGSRMPSSA